MSQSGIERRRESRTPARGDISLFFSDPEPFQLQAQLVDVSSSGFRAAHNCPALRLGQEIGFRHASFEGRARVMWNRIADEGVESGFLLLRR